MLTRDGHLSFFLSDPALRLIGVVCAGLVGLGWGFGGGSDGFFEGFCVMSVRLQQRLVYERLQKSRESIIAANKSLGERAALIAGGGTALATFFGAGEMWSSGSSPLVLLVSSSIASLFVFAAASYVWVPMDAVIPGSLSEDDLWESIIDESEDVAVANMIRDEIASVERERAGNAIRAKAFRVMLIGVWVQVTFVFFAVWLGN